MHLNGMPRAASRASRHRHGSARYQAPHDFQTITLSELLQLSGRAELETKQLDMLRRGETTSGRDINVYIVGDVELLKTPCVSIVGTREVSDRGRQRTEWLAGKLAEAGLSIVSGLAKGVDTAAHESAIAAGGKTVAVIGTPLTKAYPIENAELQETIYRDHLLISPFAEGETVYKSNFPARNRVMAALSDATVIIEASDTGSFNAHAYFSAPATPLITWLVLPGKLGA